jgi:secreted Zn-dependent insulinase-like peptidase
MAEPNPEITAKLLDLPPENTLIPRDFDILEPNELYSSSPHLIKQWDDTDLWYMKDDKFGRPEAYA